ncbi:MAG: AmmeMemoRadiSam system protein A [Lachnospiraceae bacterium]|nr:AmmeMemoRadiSam system protein A [Lachnospiraceae bacterium]
MGILAGFMVPHPPMIVPEVGCGGEAQIAETTAAYEKAAAEIAALEPETIIITSPHSVMYADYFHISPGVGAEGDLGNFRAPEVSFHEEYDHELVNRIIDIAFDRNIPAGSEGERSPLLDHGTMVPLYFIRKHYGGGKIVRIGLSGLSFAEHYRLGMCIKQAVEALDRRTVFVASGDLSHKLQDYGPYGFAPEGPEYDRRIMDSAGRGAFGEFFDFSEEFCDKAAECGHRSFVIMAGAFDGTAVKAKAYSHQDVTGVGYGICCFYPEGKDDSRHFLDSLLEKNREKAAAADPYVRLARASLESFIRSGRILRVPEDIPPTLRESLPQEIFTDRAGAFVSIHKNGKLRGCIGTIAPTADNLAEEIVGNAISASTRDPRFDAITTDELDWLEINVDVLGEAEDISSKDELDVKRYGVIVTSGFRRGLLLPDLEGVDDVDTQVSIALRKGGISENEDYSLQRFEVIRHR